MGTRGKMGDQRLVNMADVDADVAQGKFKFLMVSEDQQGFELAYPHVELTQEEYDELDPPLPNRLYVIVEE